jgi:hypothetical protein
LWWCRTARDELLAAIRRQVEYYFSKENLQSDAFLVSKMDANLSVPISVVMKFSKMKRLTTAENDLVEALSTSKVRTLHDRPFCRAEQV